MRRVETSATESDCCNQCNHVVDYTKSYPLA
jgi:hypothetical protein